MEDSNSDEPERKRPHLDSISTQMARHSSDSPDNNKPVDGAVLQYQNQKLVQQLDVQKHELHDLEVKIEELKAKQTSYDESLIAVNQLWNQLVDDLILLGVRTGAGKSTLQALDREDSLRGSVPACPAEDIFLCRLLHLGSIERNGKDKSPIDKIKEVIDFRRLSTRELMKCLEDNIRSQTDKADIIARVLDGNPSSEDVIIQLSKIDDLMKEEAHQLHEVIDILHSKHKEYSDEIQMCIQRHSADQSEIKHLAVELEESMSELEESRRKLVSLKMQKNVASGVQIPISGAVNGKLSSPEKNADKSMGLRELKDSIEEAKILAADRLSELQDAQEDNQILSKQLQDLQNELKDDKHIYSSRPYTLLNDQLQHWSAEVERYKVLTDNLQADRSYIMRREKELNVKSESLDASMNGIDNADSKVEELEKQLQKIITENNELEMKMEEAVQDAGMKDIKAEFQVMTSALSKERGMMEAQLNRWKETALEAHSLREKAQSLRSLIGTKTSEVENLVNKCAEQTKEIKFLKALIENLQKKNQETEFVLDMIGQQIYDTRGLAEIKESEQRAHAQAAHLKNALEEHSLYLRIKAANESEAACQKRLAAAESEMAELRVQLDAAERGVLELKEAIRIKDEEAEAYISEIETIGQAYEDMQAQNQRLLRMVTERDEYNIKLVSESVKTKQAQSSLLSEKQASAKQLQLVNTSLESLKSRIAHGQEQMKVSIAEALKSSQEDRHLAVNLETTKWELADADKELKWLKSAVSASEKENEQVLRKMDEVRKELEIERRKRRKIDDELAEVNRQIDEMTSESGEAAIQKLEDEIKECKAILKCGVCFDRPKEVVITKCYHLFCNPCIQRNLEIRHRKCPGCGTAFGQNDVRFVKI